EQLVHIANASHLMSQMLLKGEKVAFSEPDASQMTKEEIIVQLEEKLSATAEIIASLTEDELKEKIKTFDGNEIPRQQVIIFIHDHLTNHRAKANLYVRMNDITPPKYKYY
ncbi:MAG: hypothetical protein AAGI07_16835, partial [Bacteroidota bacterium]